MSAQGFIVAYTSLWCAWSSLVGIESHRRSKLANGPRFMSYLFILACAMAPVTAFALIARYTRWIPGPVNEMLSLMTPVFLAVFGVQQLRLLSPGESRVAC